MSAEVDRLTPDVLAMVNTASPRRRMTGAGDERLPTAAAREPPDPLDPGPAGPFGPAGPARPATPTRPARMPRCIPRRLPPLLIDATTAVPTTPFAHAASRSMRSSSPRVRR